VIPDLAGAAASLHSRPKAYRKMLATRQFGLLPWLSGSDKVIANSSDVSSFVEQAETIFVVSLEVI